MHYKSTAADRRKLQKFMTEIQNVHNSRYIGGNKRLITGSELMKVHEM